MKKNGLIYVIYNVNTYEIKGIYTDLISLMNDYECTHYEYDFLYDWEVINLEEYVRFLKKARNNLNYHFAVYVEGKYIASTDFLGGL